MGSIRRTHRVENHCVVLQKFIVNRKERKLVFLVGGLCTELIMMVILANSDLLLLPPLAEFTACGLPSVSSQPWAASC